MVTVDNDESIRKVTITGNISKRYQIQKLEVYNEILQRLKEAGNDEAVKPGFDDDLLAHFNSLPNRYALDVNAESAEDVLMHKRLLSLAHDPANGIAFNVRIVQVSTITESNSDDFVNCSSPGKQIAQSIHPPPAFGSSPNLEALAHEASGQSENLNADINGHTDFSRPMHEITFSTDDKPKLLNQLTTLLDELGLNIQEAHVFSTVDRYSLDVFVVDGWPYEETEQLRDALQRKLSKLESSSDQCSSSPVCNHLRIPNDGADVWEVDPQFLKLGHKVASGSYGDLYKGTYHSQEVAIKVLKAEKITSAMQQEFAQEVYILRKVRHKNVVQFIGACTKPSNLCIVTEFMSGGSVYDYLHKQKGTFKLPLLLMVALDISRGMNYLHQNNIIHRDLKAANLLMDENDVVKVADFGVARVKAQTGVMTAETGTYRWMAPEVIEHKPYDLKVDVFSFGIVLWELLTGKLPYEYLTPVQAAIGVVQKGLRPTIPKNTHPKLAELLGRCWHKDPSLRPDFTEIIDILKRITFEVETGEERRTEKGSVGLYWLISMFGATGEKRKRAATDVAFGSIDSENVKDTYYKYASFFRRPSEIKKDEQVPNFVNVFYDLVTDMYEYLWGQSFHFSPSIPGKTKTETARIHEEMAVDLINVKPGQKIIDVGCGVGGPMRAIAAHSGCNVVGITINEYQVSRAKAYNQKAGMDKQCQVVCGNFLEMPFEDESFDGAYSIEATCHAPKLEDVYREIFRVLKPGSMYVSYEWVTTDLYHAQNPKHVDIIQGIERGDALPGLRSYTDIAETAKNVGFEVVKEKDLAKPPANPWWSRLQKGRFDIWRRHMLVVVLEKLGFVAKGTVDVQEMLLQAVLDLAKGGETGIFSPMHMILCKKPGKSQQA